MIWTDPAHFDYFYGPNGVYTKKVSPLCGGALAGPAQQAQTSDAGSDDDATTARPGQASIFGGAA